MRTLQVDLKVHVEINLFNAAYISLTLVHLESEHSKCRRAQPLKYTPPNSGTSSDIVKICTLIL